MPDDVLGQLVLASHLLGADRAVANFGGGNTSAKGTATDHAGREIDVMWVKGSGTDLATMGRRATSRALRLDEVLPLFERDAMSDEDMVAYLPAASSTRRAALARSRRCCTRSSRRRTSHHTHPDGINVLAGTRRRRAARARVLRRRGGLDPLHPARASRSPSRSATAVRANPAASSSSCSPSTGSSCGATAPRRPTGARSRSINRAVDVRQRAHERRAALRRPARRARPTTSAATSCSRAVLPALRGALSQRARQGAGRRHVAARRSSSPPRARRPS